MIEIIFLIIILAISIWLHEYAHAITSYRLWDPTPMIQKRLTPNPIAHIDIIWFLMIFIIHFWWWKPVQVNPLYYKNPIRDELLVALAWPFTNIILAIIWITISIIYIKITWTFTQDMILSFWTLFSFINISLAIFNMLPIPPLDWFRLVKFFYPNFAYKIEKYSLQLSIAFILIIMMPPTSSMIGNIIQSASQIIFNIIYFTISQII